MNLVLDLGNSKIKAGIFNQHNLNEVFVSDNNDLDQFILNISEIEFDSAIVSSVTVIPEILINSLHKICKNILIFDKNTPLKLKNHYKSPETLGNDRLALAYGGAILFKNKNVLIIDAGSCITYDFINSKGEYIGGGISPGIEMRFKSLNSFTNKLPLIRKEQISFITGKTTNESILSGVLNGTFYEVNSIISYYKNKYKQIKIVLSGGDAIFLSKKIKNRIFVEQNFLLLSLNQILLNNV